MRDLSFILPYADNPLTHNALLVGDALKRHFQLELEALTPAEIDQLMPDSVSAVVPGKLEFVQQTLDGAMRPLDFLYGAAVHPVAFANQLKLEHRVAEVDHLLDWMATPRTGEQLRSAMRFEFSYMRSIIQGQDLDILNWTLMDDAKAFEEKVEKMKAKARLLERIFLRKIREKKSDAEFKRDWAAYQEFVEQNEAFIEEIERVARQQQEQRSKQAEAQSVLIGLSASIIKAERLQAEAAQQFAEFANMTAHDITNAFLANIAEYEDLYLTPEEMLAFENEIKSIITGMSDDYLEAVQNTMLNAERVLEQRKMMQESHWPQPIETDPRAPALVAGTKNQPLSAEEKIKAAEQNKAALAAGAQVARGESWYVTPEDLLHLVSNEAAREHIIAILKGSHLPPPYSELINNPEISDTTLEKIIAGNAELIEAHLSCLRFETDPEKVKPLRAIQALLYKDTKIELAYLEQVVMNHPDPASVLERVLPPEAFAQFNLDKSASVAFSKVVSKHYQEKWKPALVAAQDEATFKSLLGSDQLAVYESMFVPDEKGKLPSFEEAKAKTLAQIEGAHTAMLQTPSSAVIESFIDRMPVSDRKLFIEKRKDSYKVYYEQLREWFAQPGTQKALSEAIDNFTDEEIVSLHRAKAQGDRARATQESAQQAYTAMFDNHKGKSEVLGALVARNMAVQKVVNAATGLIEKSRKAKNERLEEAFPVALSDEEREERLPEIVRKCFGQASKGGKEESAPGLEAPSTGRFQEVAKTVIEVSRFLNQVKEARAEAEQAQVKSKEHLANVHKRFAFNELPEEMRPELDSLALNTFAKVFESLGEDEKYSKMNDFIDSFVNNLPPSTSEMEVQQKFRQRFSNELSDFDKSTQVQLQSYMLLKHNVNRLAASYPRPRTKEDEAAYQKELSKLIKKEAFRKSYMSCFVLRDSLPPELQSPRAIEEEVMSIDRRFLRPKQEPTHKALEQGIKVLENSYRNGQISYADFKRQLDEALERANLTKDAEHYLRFRHRQSVLRNILKKPELTQEDRAQVEKNMSEIASEMEAAKISPQARLCVEQVGVLNELNGLRLEMDREMSQANGLLAAMSENPDAPFEPGQEAVAEDLTKRYNQAQARYAKALSRMTDGKKMMMAEQRPKPSQNQKAVSDALNKAIETRMALEKHKGQVDGLKAQMKEQLAHAPEAVAQEFAHKGSSASESLSPDARRLLERVNKEQGPASRVSPGAPRMY